MATSFISPSCSLPLFPSNLPKTREHQLGSSRRRRECTRFWKKTHVIVSSSSVPISAKSIQRRDLVLFGISTSTALLFPSHMVVCGEEELAFQNGETTEILPGHLCATPHCVQAPRGEEAIGVECSTFALFMQQDWDENLKFPAPIHHHQELIPPNGTLTLGEYSEMLLNKYYHQNL